MNSKKIKNFVKKIIETKDTEEFDDIVDKIRALNHFINDVELRSKEKSDILKEYFGKYVLSYPEDVSEEIEILLITELKKNIDIFKTYKIRYVLNIINPYVPIATMNDRFVAGILYKENSDTSSFESMKMLEGITLD